MNKYYFQKLKILITSILLFPFFLSLQFCNQDLDIQSYTIQKQKSVSFGTIENKKKSNTLFSWDSPKSWKEKNNKSMALVSWEIESSTAAQANANIVVLTKKAAKIDDNVNRWRGQIFLQKLSSKEIKKIIHKQKAKLGTATWFRLLNFSKKQAILAAILPYKDLVIFVKLKGSLKTVLKNEKEFLTLLKSVTVLKK